MDGERMRSGSLVRVRWGGEVEVEVGGGWIWDVDLDGGNSPCFLRIGGGLRILAPRPHDDVCGRRARLLGDLASLGVGSHQVLADAHEA